MNIPSFLGLTREQQDLLLDLPFDGRHLVSGPPGSGKTLLAVSRAIMLDIADREVVLLTYSNVLRQYTIRLAEQADFNGTISTCHSWLRKFWLRNFGNQPPTKEDGVALDWTAIIIALARSTTAFEQKIECLVVDEGQDLPKEFYALCAELTVNTTVFADDNQRIGNDQSTLREIGALLGEGVEEHLLSTNCRNTRQIAEFANLFYCGSPGRLPPTPSREGPLPRIEQHASEDRFADALAAYVRENKELEIGVALRRQRQLISLRDKLQRRGIRNVQTYASGSPHFRNVDFSKPGVRIFSPVSMKGQEFDTVFIPNLELYTGDISSAALRMELYVLATRARNELYLSHETQIEPALIGEVSSSLLQRHPTPHSG